MRSAGLQKQRVQQHGPARPQRARVVQVAARATSVRQMASQMKDVRAQMEKDEQLSVLMAGLRGANIDNSDFAGADVKMSLVEVTHHEGDEALPLTYDPDAIAAYWERRPVSIATRILQLTRIAGGFVGSFVWDAIRGRLKEREVTRAIELRNIMTSLGPAYIKLGQALSIRPDLLSPAAMNEMQKLCDKVPSFDSRVAMQVVQEELGRPWQEVFAELTPEPIAAASLGQVYKGRLKTGEVVAVKVQRPGVLETVTIDLFIIRTIGLAIRKYAPDLTKRADIVALLDEWASRFFEELDYVKEGQNATRFAEQMKRDLPQVVVPLTYTDYTSRRVLTTEWLEGEKLSQSKADDVGDLVNVGVICFLKQLLDTGFFHADPHPGNLIRTPDGRLAILDFGLMSEVDDNIKYGMIEAISHLIHRDYEAIVKDFVTLDFIPEGTDLQPILPVLAKVFDRALEGGGAKNINFQELAADLAQITFDYPFRIPPYFALIIRAIGVLEGIALVGNPDFAIVDEAYPYIARRLLTDPAPELRESFEDLILKDGQFRWSRLENLLREGSKSQDFDPAQLWLLAEWLLSPGASGVRESVVAEVARMVDAVAAGDVRERIVQRTGSYTVAERLVPPQPQEGEALARANLLLASIRTRLAATALQDPSAALSSGMTPVLAAPGISTTSSSGVRSIPSPSTSSSSSGGRGASAPPPSSSFPAHASSSQASTSGQSHADGALGGLLPVTGSGPFGLLTPGDVNALVARWQSLASESLPRLQALAQQPGATDLARSMSGQLARRFAARAIKLAFGSQALLASGLPGLPNLGGAAPAGSASTSGSKGR
mmetsp:Transcript_17309/g.43443  ORF Transcript_17309/g.43443 Transcript_17309/m.43443 type:complete len:830 (-) Transcript_17309:636-3125(-)